MEKERRIEGDRGKDRKRGKEMNSKRDIEGGDTEREIKRWTGGDRGKIERERKRDE
jgi:hypothetical protein